MLRFWRWLKALVMPANGRHAHPDETRGYWDEYDEEVDWLPDDEGYEDFPIVCANGCPEGHLGRHKFSCRETRAEHALTYESYDWPHPVDREAAWVRPYVGKRRVNV